MHVFRKLLVPALALILTFLGSAVTPALSQTPDALPVPSRVIGRVDDAQLVKLAGNTHPLAQSKYDQGLVDPGKLLERIVLVLQRSPEQQQALDAFNVRQYDPKSQDFHHWLHADEFGQLYGPSDADIAAVTSWLQNHGFQIYNVSKGKVTIEFTGTVAQVQDAFHVEMHRYLVNGEQHIANDRDPSIPAALAPVVTGVASLHDFFGKPQSWFGKYVVRNTRTGVTTLANPQPPAQIKTSANLNRTPTLKPGSGSKAVPEFTFTDPDNFVREDLAPYDFAAIYNIGSLWSAGTTGKGVSVAISAGGDIVMNDVSTYRTAFNVQPTDNLPVVIYNGSDPGITGYQGENTEDVEMVGAAAPGATVDLVVSADTATTGAYQLSDAYIVDNEIAPIMSASYGECEKSLGTAGNSAFNSIWQQGATEGISIFESSGDQGSAGCSSQDTAAPTADKVGLQVNGMASSQYVTAVGGTDLAWYYTQPTIPRSTYWNTTNDSNQASAKGYIPEIAWNTTCSNPLLLNIVKESGGTAYPNVEAFCNAALDSDLYPLVHISAGSGGESQIYTKPSWQSGSGVPADGMRDLPDMAMFASYGYGNPYDTGIDIPSSAILICLSEGGNVCDYTDPEDILFQENGGTSAASPFTAGVMAMVVQKTGAAQGLANPVLYQLAAKQVSAGTNCASNTVASGNTCVFYDVTEGSNAQVCITGDTNCVTSTSGDEVGILSGYNAAKGYDQTTGLGTLNVANLVSAWPATATGLSVTLSPTSLTFASTAVGSTTAAQTVTLKNTSAGAVALSTISITGTDASSFIKSATTCGTSLAVKASCTISVEFKPAAAGALTASLSVADNATGTPQLVSLKGTGTATTAPAVKLSATSLTFASTTVGSTTAAQTVTLTNSGNATLDITSIAVTGADASSFVISAKTCTGTLAASASCTFSVEFKPAAAGSLTGDISITDNAPASPQLVALTGTGTSALTVTLSPTSLSFATTEVGSTTAAQTVTVKNTSTSAVALGTISVTGTDASSFIKSATTCTTSLAASASCTISVEFKPAVAGALTASLSVADNATGSPQLVALKGTGTAPAVKLSATSLTFASTTVGSTTAAQTITLTNSGTATLDITSIAVTGTDASSFLISAKTCTGTLGASDSCTFSVEFKPAAAGTLTGDVSITDNAAGSPQEVTLTGTGTAAVTGLSLTPTSLTFASTAVGNTSEAQVETIKNTGTATVTLKSIAVTGTNSTSFEDLSACGTSLAANASCTVLVSFKPTTTGTLTATLSITSSAATAAQLVTLTGTATAEPTLKLSSTSIAFPTTASGATSEAVVVTLTNSGTTTATLDDIVLGGTNPTDFVELNDCGATLAAGASCGIYVSFKPAASASYTGSVLIYDNAASSPQTIALSGTGN